MTCCIRSSSAADVTFSLRLSLTLHHLVGRQQKNFKKGSSLPTSVRSHTTITCMLLLLLLLLMVMAMMVVVVTMIMMINVGAREQVDIVQNGVEM